MQTLTPALLAILKEKFQAGASGFRGKFEVDLLTPGSYVSEVLVDGPIWYYRMDEASGVLADSSGHNIAATVVGSPTYGIDGPSEIPGTAMRFDSGDHINLTYSTGTGLFYAEGPHTDETIEGWFRTTDTGWMILEQNRGFAPAGNGDTLSLAIGPNPIVGGASGAGQVTAYINVTSFYRGKHSIATVNDGQWHHILATLEGNTGVDPTPSQITIYIDGLPTATADDPSVGGGAPAPSVGESLQQLFYEPNYPPSGTLDAKEMAWYSKVITGDRVLLHYSAGVGAFVPGSVTTLTLYPKLIGIDKSLRLVSDSADVEFENESIPLGWGPTNVLVTNSRCRIYQWYGEEANAVQTFEGIIDRVSDHRDVLTTSVACRDMMAILIDQTFGATAPQGADEDGAVRTVANGVYLSMEVSDIVEDILDRAGWPTADRDVMGTSYVLDEFIINDGMSWADAIIGDAQLSGLVGYSAWADEMGVFHFAPTLISQNFTDPETPAYTFRSGEDIVALDDDTDQYDLRTRIKVRGPLTTTTLQDTWRELWRTSKFHKPVGLWHDPSDAANLRVLDRGTKRLYKLRQSDRAILSSVDVSGICAHPLGLSGDPADSAVYWLLNAPWIDGGSGGNKVKKVRKSDNHVLATFSIPSGRWSALKVSSSYLYLTNLDTDRFYRRSKTDGSAIANYSHTYNAVVQANPSGLMINGTTLYLFWANGGTTARFLVCDESAPGTVTDVVKTAGTALHGGEMDTVTDIDCYGDSDSLGLVAKFTLAEAVDQTSEVFAEVVDTDLEDELGELAQLENREHDTHPTDPDHPYETRRMTLDLSVITSLAQATETAQRQLDIASQRRRVLDVGIVGNPGLQKTDLVVVEDPITDINTSFAVDTYRTMMSADGTYLGTVAMLPVEDVDDDPDDEGSAGS